MIELRIVTSRKFTKERDYEDFKAALKAEYPENWFETLEKDGKVGVHSLDGADNDIESETYWLYRKDGGTGLVNVEGVPV